MRLWVFVFFAASALAISAPASAQRAASKPDSAAPAATIPPFIKDLPVRKVVLYKSGVVEL